MTKATQEYEQYELPGIDSYSEPTLKKQFGIPSHIDTHSVREVVRARVRLEYGKDVWRLYELNPYTGEAEIHKSGKGVKAYKATKKKELKALDKKLRLLAKHELQLFASCETRYLLAFKNEILDTRSRLLPKGWRVCGAHSRAVLEYVFELHAPESWIMFDCGKHHAAVKHLRKVAGTVTFPEGQYKRIKSKVKKTMYQYLDEMEALQERKKQHHIPWDPF